MEDEELLFFTRFPAEKQDQVRGLVEYATLMGLTGKDLISIGGKLDRLKLAQAKRSNLEIIKGFKILPIGNDKKLSPADLEHAFDRRFKLESTIGYYTFERDSSSYYNMVWRITNTITKVSITHSPDHWGYALPKVRSTRASRYALLLDISAGLLQLNF